MIPGFFQKCVGFLQFVQMTMRTQQNFSQLRNYIDYNHEFRLPKLMVTEGLFTKKNPRTPPKKIQKIRKNPKKSKKSKKSIKSEKKSKKSIKSEKKSEKSEKQFQTIPRIF